MSCMFFISLPEIFWKKRILQKKREPTSLENSISLASVISIPDRSIELSLLPISF